ncbi:MAG: hypothetical protein WC975_16330 [Phycisphaerae bacterium]
MSNVVAQNACAPIPALNPEKWEQVIFTEHPQHDTMWTMIRGHDGHIYIGLCLESRGGGVAQLYKYDTKEHRLIALADMGEVTGELPDSGHATQGKIHFSLCHARNGNKIFGATHCTTPPMGHPIWSPFSMWGDPVMNFPGGHIFSHDIQSGITTDFGVIVPNEGIPYLMLDENRGYLYGVTYPRAHFFRTDLVGRHFKDYGRISGMYPISMIFDTDGNLFTSDSSSRLIKYDVSQDRIRFLGVKPYCQPWNLTGYASWITDMGHGTDGFIYGCSYSNDHLFRFDPKQEEPVIEDLGPGLEDRPSRNLRCIVADHKGHFYYTANPMLDSRANNVLVRYNIASRKKELIGIMSLNGKHYYPWRAVCMPDNTIYFACIHGSPPSMLVYHPD